MNLAALVIVSAFPAFVAASSLVIPTNVDWVKQNSSLPQGSGKITYTVMEVNLGAGDSLLLEAGQHKPTRFDNITGDSLRPLVICNSDHLVTISNPIDGYYGLSFKKCRYIKLSGANNASLVYGILVTGIPAGSAVSIGDFSSNFEVERVVIDDVGSSGIVAKTDPDCENYESYKSFVMFDLRFHHNLIRKVGNEGFYIGNTGYREGAGIPLSCKDPIVSKHILPHKIVGVNVYANIVDSTGWDAIQVSATENAEIFDNYITHDSYARYPNQQSGIMIGEPTSRAHIYNNIIRNGWGNAIQVFGTGIHIYNNVIIYRRAKGTEASDSKSPSYASSPIHAIYINDKVCEDKSVQRLPHIVAFNTIIVGMHYVPGIPFPQGIDVSNNRYIRGSMILQNLVVIDTLNPVKKKATWKLIPGDPKSREIPIPLNFINPGKSKMNFMGLNMCCNKIARMKFSDPAKHDFSLRKNSPAVDPVFGRQNMPLPSFIMIDYLHVKRPQGKTEDFGAYEFVITSKKKKVD